MDFWQDPPRFKGGAHVGPIRCLEAMAHCLQYVLVAGLLCYRKGAERPTHAFATISTQRVLAPSLYKGGGRRHLSLSRHSVVKEQLTHDFSPQSISDMDLQKH